MLRRGAWKGSQLYKLLVPLSRRLGGNIAKTFMGLVVGRNRILYRHAQHYFQLRPKGKNKWLEYERLSWTKPFGDLAAHRTVNYVLLHASEPKEIFFLIPIRKAKMLARAFPKHLNIAVDPVWKSTARNKIERYQMSRIDIRRKLLK